MISGLKELKKALLQSHQAEAKGILQKHLSRGDRIKVLEKLLNPVLEEIGSEWERGEVSLIQVYMAGRICEEALDSILIDDESKDLPHPVSAITCLSDNHTLGKRIVSSLFKTYGYSLIDYGGGIDVESLFNKVREDKVQILLISALMLNTVLKIKELRKLLDENDMSTILIVGGAPFRFDENLWKEVGADYTAHTAIEGLNLYTRLINEVKV